MGKQLTFKVPSDLDRTNAKRFLRDYCGISAGMLTRLKQAERGITMNGELLRTIDNVVGGAEVIITLPDEKCEILPVEGDLDVCYEDKYLLVVNKPPFMPVHPVKQHQSDTLANIVAYYIRKKNESFVFRAINRLDRDTSGLVLITKDRFCANVLKHSVEKSYFAVTHGEIRKDGLVAAPIGLLSDSKMVRHVLNEGVPAITHYHVICYGSDRTFLRLKLETGKTHQIRCHMASLGHPLLGDDLYGGKRDLIKRQALHCGEMCFVHPITAQKITVKAEIPEDIKRCFSGLPVDTNQQ